MVDAAPDAIVGIGRDGKIRFANRQAERMFGYPPGELVGAGVEDLLPDRYKQVHVSHRDGYFGAPRPRSMGEGLDLFGKRKDGSEFPVDVSLNALETSEGRMGVAFVRDITERKRNEQRFGSLVNAAPDAVVGIDHSGKIRLVNIQTEELFGYRRDELLGKPIEVLLPLRFRDGHVRHRDGYLGSPRPRSMGQGLELSGRRKDGTEFPVDVSLSAIETSDGILATAFVRDVSARKEAERERANLAAIVASSDDAIIGKSLTGVITSWNAGAERLYGYPSKEAVGQPITLIAPPDRVEESPALIERLRKGVRVDHYETVRRRKDGTLIDVSLSLSPVRGPDGSILGASVIARDITQERRAAEALRQANIDLESFSHTISHDLRAPLRAMRGFSQALSEDYGSVLDAEGQDYLKRIVVAGGSMERLIDDLLEYSRLGRRQVETRRVSLDATIAAVLAPLEGEIKRTSAQVTIAGPLGNAIAEPQLLAQALSNLVSNALKYVKPGARPVVRIRAARAGHRVRLWIEDDGIGIPAEHMARIWLPFERLHGVEAYPGTGVGLAIVQRAVERIGGTVGAESTVGKGSRFWIELAGAEGAPP